ncbi:MAG: nitrous oxide-stimulated promoter family protein [Treponema sp.]|nr:nitrous oxide-stimulated promoter family protein [Treponema sp.]
MLQSRTQKDKDTELVGRFTEWFCRARHTNCPKSLLESEGVLAGVYRNRAPLLCTECADFMRYAESRTRNCPLNPKPFCSVCEIKCYNQPMGEYSRSIMRYSGPRSVFSVYWIDALRYLFKAVLSR